VLRRTTDAALPPDELLEVRTIVRRVIGSRVRDRHMVDDLVQETLTRVLASWDRIDPVTLVPYAITTARNVVASTWRQLDTTDRNLHRVVDLLPVERPEDAVLGREESEAVSSALTRLSDRDRETLLAHDVEGRDLASLAQDLTPAAVRWPPSSSAPGPGCASSTCSRGTGGRRRPPAAGRSCSRCPVGTVGARPRWT
jgi:serine/threonine-protein kinase RsbT